MTKAVGVSVLIAAVLVAFGDGARGDEAARYNFENDILPILSRFGCNTSGCHGKAEGQNGFKLSIFGFDPEADHAALTQEGRGRRVVSTVPERSLLLAKASGGVPHGGGVRIFRGTDDYRTLADWIAVGSPFGSAHDPRVVSVEVSPRERELKFGEKQPLRVTAIYSDGRRLNVTRHARFQSNSEGLALVDDAGVVTTGQSPGDVAIMASYLGEVDVFRALIPRPERIDNYPVLPESNFIDGLVYAKLRKLNELPSLLVSDSDFLRRVFLDIIGTLPTAVESREFLEDKDTARRERLVDRLLAKSEFADFWALKWSDVLRVDRQVLGHKAAYAYYRWIRDSLAANMPYDQFCRQLVAADGPLTENPAGHFYKVVSKPGEMGGALSQVFLGVRIDCAQCHHHPFDRWGQADYLGMQAFFTQVSFKSVAGTEFLLAGNSAATVHPRSGQTVFAHALATEVPPAEPAGDRRKLLAAWMTSPDNPWFARNLVNRTWSHFLGRGLVEPVDDVRLSNPPTNPALLDALAQSFIQSEFDFKQLIRTITASRVYQTSASTEATNERDDQNYARALLRPVEAEVLLDAVCQVTGIPEKFQGVPSGTRAIQLWDSQTTHNFLKLFGRPTRTTACECERTKEPSVAQVLHILNSTDLHGKLVHAGGRIARLTATLTDDTRLVEELYLTFYSRFPTPSERDTAVAYLGQHSTNRRLAVEDLAWSMLNTAEFVFNH